MVNYTRRKLVLRTKCCNKYQNLLSTVNINERESNNEVDWSIGGGNSCCPDDTSDAVDLATPASVEAASHVATRCLFDAGPSRVN